MERFRFPPWVNRLITASMPVLGVGALYAVGVLAYGVSPRTTNVGYSPKQPIPYSHALHVGQLKLDCRYCHTTVDKAAYAAIPPTGVCLNCHSSADANGAVPTTAVHTTSRKLLPLRRNVLVVPQSPVAPNHVYTITFQGALANANLSPLTANSMLTGISPTVSLAPVMDGTGSDVQTLTLGGTITGGTFTLSYGHLTTAPINWNADPATLAGNIQIALAANAMFGTTKPILWEKIHDLADFVYFDHSAHVNRGVGCVSCHGRVDKMEQVYQAESLSMSWCLQCHRHPEPNLRPLDRVTDMEWQPAADESREQVGARLRKELNINPSTNCSTCHR